MSEYKPTSRRHIADTLRKTANISVPLCVKWNISPNAISIMSIFAASMAGICFWKSGELPWLLIPAAGFCYVRLWFNMLDGMVALAAGKASMLGEVFNEIPDRASDIIIFAGVAHSGLCNPLIAYWVIILAVLVAYVGTFGQATGVGRMFNGVMSKPWRMVIIHIGSWIALGMAYANAGQRGITATIHDPLWQGLTVIDFTLLLIILGCLQTLWVRLGRIVSKLQQPSA